MGIRSRKLKCFHRREIGTIQKSYLSWFRSSVIPTATSIAKLSHNHSQPLSVPFIKQTLCTTTNKTPTGKTIYTMGDIKSINFGDSYYGIKVCWFVLSSICLNFGAPQNTSHCFVYV